MHPTNLLLPSETHEKFKHLAARSNMGVTLTNIVKKYDGTKLVPTTTKATGLNLDPAVVEALDRIKDANGLKSRNQAVTLLIEQAWKDHQTQLHTETQV